MILQAKRRMGPFQVLWCLQWQILECTRLQPAADLSSAMAAAIERLDGEGWHAEATREVGFVFVRNGVNRGLLIATTGDIQIQTRATDGRQTAIDFMAEMRKRDLLVQTNSGMIP